MVQSAQGKSVALFVRSAGLMPFDVRGFQSDRYRSKPNIETADGTAVLVSAQYPVPEIRAASDYHPSIDFKLDSYGVENVLMNALREVGV